MAERSTGFDRATLEADDAMGVGIDLLWLVGIASTSLVVLAPALGARRTRRRRARRAG